MLLSPEHPGQPKVAGGVAGAGTGTGLILLAQSQLAGDLQRWVLLAAPTLTLAISVGAAWALRAAINKWCRRRMRDLAAEATDGIAAVLNTDDLPPGAKAELDGVRRAISLLVAEQQLSELQQLSRLVAATGDAQLLTQLVTSQKLPAPPGTRVDESEGNDPQEQSEIQDELATLAQAAPYG